jgi:Protein of unknown function (DUF1573)
MKYVVAALVTALVLVALARLGASEGLVKIGPAARQDLGTRGAGEKIEVQYTITNIAVDNVSLSIVAKSCGCIGVRLSNEILLAGQGGTVSLSVTAPEFGVGEGEVVLLVSGGGEELIELEYQVTARIGVGVVIAPSAIEIAETEWRGGWRGLIVVRCSSSLSPKGQAPAAPSISGARITSPIQWRSVAGGSAWSCELSVDTGPIDTGSVDRLVLIVNVAGQEKSVVLRRGQ